MRESRKLKTRWRSEVDSNSQATSQTVSKPSESVRLFQKRGIAEFVDIMMVAVEARGRLLTPADSRGTAMAKKDGSEAIQVQAESVPMGARPAPVASLRIRFAPTKALKDFNCVPRP